MTDDIARRKRLDTAYRLVLGLLLVEPLSPSLRSRLELLRELLEPESLESKRLRDRAENPGCRIEIAD